MRRLVRALARLLVGTVILAVVAAIVAILWARSESGRRHVRDVAVEETRRVLPGLEIGRIGGDLTRNFVLEDVVLRDRAGREAVRIERVEARLDLFGLIHHEIRLEELVLVRPRVDARANLAELVQSTPGGGTAYDFDLQSIEVRQGEVTSDTYAVTELGATGALRMDAGGLVAKISSVTSHARVAEREGDIRARGDVVHRAEKTEIVIEELSEQGLWPVPLALRGKIEDRRFVGDLSLGKRGRAHVTADVDPSGYHAEIDLNADPHDLDTRLQSGNVVAHVSATGTGLPFSAGSLATLSLTLDRSRIENLAIAKAEVRGHLDGRAWRIERADVRALGLTIHASGHGQGEQLALDLATHATKPIRMHGVQAEGDIRLHLSGRLPRSLALQAQLDVRKVRFEEIAIDHLAGTIEIPQIRAPTVGTLHLVAQNLGIAGRALPWTVRIDGRSRPELAVTAQISGKSMLAEAVVRGHVGPSRVDLAIERLFVERNAERLTLGQPTSLRWRRGQGLELAPAELSGQVLGVHVPRAQLSAQLDSRMRELTVNLDGAIGQNRAPVHLRARAPLSRKGALDVALDAQGLRLAELPSLLLRRQELRDGQIDLHLHLAGQATGPEGRLDLTLRDARLGPLAQLGAELHATVRADSIALNGVGWQRSRRVLNWSGTWLSGLGPLLAGHVPWRAPMHLQANLEAVDLVELHALDPRLAIAKGVIKGDAEVSGDLARPIVRAHLNADGAQLDVVRFNRLDATAVWEGESIRGTLVAVPASGGRLQGQLSWGAHARELRLASRSLDLRFLKAILPGLRDVGGTLDGDLTLQTRGDQTVSTNGTLAVHQGRLGIRGIHEMKDVEVGLDVQSGRVQITKLHARSDDGSLDGAGNVALDGLKPSSVDITAQARNFELGYGGILHARLNGRIHVTGSTVDDRLALRAVVENGHLGLEQIGGDRDLQSTSPLVDVRFVDAAAREETKKAPAGRQPVRGPVRDLEIALVLPNFAVRGKEINAALDGRIAIATSPEGLPIIKGEVATQRGQVEVFGQSFDIEHARLRWSGQPGVTNPAIDVRVTRSFADATVVVELDGSLDAPDIHLTSDPPIYDQAQLVAMVLSGQPAGDLNLSPAGTISAVILRQIVDKIAPRLPLDFMRVDLARESAVPGAPLGVSDVTETRVEVGKRLSDRITLSYVHLFGAPENQNHNEAHVDYRLGRRWIVETSFGDAGVGGMDVLWTWRY